MHGIQNNSSISVWLISFVSTQLRPKMVSILQFPQSFWMKDENKIETVIQGIPSKGSRLKCFNFPSNMGHSCSFFLFRKFLMRSKTKIKISIYENCLSRARFFLISEKEWGKPIFYDLKQLNLREICCILPKGSFCKPSTFENLFVLHGKEANTSMLNVMKSKNDEKTEKRACS